ncbi:MAG: hypothetical protein ACRC8W_18155 [Plesiomonas shigelloides]
MNKKEIDALTDTQINVMMTAVVNKVGRYESHSNGCYVKFIQCNGEPSYLATADYVGDNSIIMPIVFGSGISLSPSRAANGEFRWRAGQFLGTEIAKFHHKNPRRAAAIVYLKTRGIL